MALDPRISLGVQPMQLPDPMAQYGKVAAIQQAQNQNALAQYQLSAAQRADEQAANRLRLFQEAGGDPNKIGNALLRTGDIEGYTKYSKAMSESQAAKLKFDADLAQRAASIYSTVTDEPSWQAARQKLAALGGDASALPTSYEPAFVQREIQQAFGIKDLAERVLTSQTLGGTARVISTPKYALPGTVPQAAVVPGSVGQVTMTPTEAANLALRQREVALGERKEERVASAGEGTELAPKEVQKREAAYPKATSAVKSFEANSDSFISDLKKLRNHPGLSNITGVIAGRTPSFTSEGRAAQALYDKIVAKGGFQALQALREASTTGGALGSVSNQEGKQLVQSFAAIDQRQDAPDVQAAIDQVIQEVEGTKARVREAYDMTYDYKTRRGGEAAPKQPDINAQALQWARSNPNDPRSAEILKRLGVK